MVQVSATCACFLFWIVAYQHNLVRWQYGCIDKFCNPSVNPAIQLLGTIFIRGNRASSSAIEIMPGDKNGWPSYKEGGFHLINLEQMHMITAYLLVVHYWPTFIQAVRRMLNWIGKLRYCMDLSDAAKDVMRLFVVLFMYIANFVLCDKHVQYVMQDTAWASTQYLGKYFLDHALLILLLVILYRSGLRMVTEGNSVLGSFYIENATLYLFPVTLGPVWSMCKISSPLLLEFSNVAFNLGYMLVISPAVTWLIVGQFRLAMWAWHAARKTIGATGGES